MFITMAKINLEIRISEESSSNPMKFFHYIRNRKPIKSRIGPLKDDNRMIQNDRSTLKSIFIDQFSSEYTIKNL
jgi:hypothetical protein